MDKNINKLIEIGFALKPLYQDFREFHICGIFKKNHLVSLANNTKKTHPFALKNGYPYPAKGLHAECLAIIRGKLEDYSGHDLIVLRINNLNRISYSRPCLICGHLVKRLNFKSVYFSNESGGFNKYP